jgi:hypothetical protein
MGGGFSFAMASFLFADAEISGNQRSDWQFENFLKKIVRFW